MSLPKCGTSRHLLHILLHHHFVQFCGQGRHLPACTHHGKLTPTRVLLKVLSSVTSGSNIQESARNVKCGASSKSHWMRNSVGPGVQVMLGHTWVWDLIVPSKRGMLPICFLLFFYHICHWLRRYFLKRFSNKVNIMVLTGRSTNLNNPLFCSLLWFHCQYYSILESIIL